MPLAHDQLNALADYLRDIREQMLQRWHDSESRDAQLTTASVVSRTQFNDHVPQILDSYERRLRAADAAERHQARVQQRANSAEHGLHRWQQGFALRETMREWGHLHLSVLQELERYSIEHTGLEGSVMPTARATLARLCAEGVCESATRYAELQQAEAASRMRDLESALQDIQQLERQRAEVWREAAHDLRGAVGVITNASAIITGQHSIPEVSRAQFGQLLQRNVAALRDMLGDLLDLSRLEAGQERRNVAPFDAAELLRELCDSLRGLAAGRNLFLNMQGPNSLPVEGDAIKVRRLVQNLMLNALKATEKGGVRVLWSVDERENAAPHWTICVQDTGPGFDLARIAPLERVLKQATVAAQKLDDKAAAEVGDADVGADPPPTLPSEAPRAFAPPVAGEGIGLSIVKRLCELLDASLELQTDPGTGTTFRVTLPSRYPH